MQSIIQIKGLSKSYRIVNGNSKESYTALRDVITEKAKKIFSFHRQPGKASTGSSHKEEFWALRDINLHIEPGERIGIIGRNGAGKSTILKILSRITEPTKGEIKIKGRVASLLEVGTGFHPELTGRENIFLNGAILGMSRAEIKKKFDEILDFAEIERFINTPVKHYSSGMSVRLAFAVAAHLEPEILIIDEVLAVGDTQFQKKCLGKMEDVSRKEGRTILFVSHDLAAVKHLTTKGVLLEKGICKFIGDPDEAIIRYTNNSTSENDIPEILNQRNSNGKKVLISAIKINEQASTNICIDDNYFYLECEFTVFEKIRTGLQVVIKYLGKPIYWLDSGHLDNYLRDLVPGKHRFTCTIPALNLASGSYTVTVAAHLPHIEWYDVLSDFIQLEIPYFSPQNNGFNVETRLGLVVPPYEWGSNITILQ